MHPPAACLAQPGAPDSWSEELDQTLQVDAAACWQFKSKTVFFGRGVFAGFKILQFFAEGCLLVLNTLIVYGSFFVLISKSSNFFAEACLPVWKSCESSQSPPLLFSPPLNREHLPACPS